MDRIIKKVKLNVKYKATYFGFLPNSNVVVGGGEVKTRTVLRAIQETKQFDIIEEVDTSNWRKHVISLAFKLLKAMFTSTHIIVVQSTSAFLSILPIILFFQRINNFETHFIPVGNCLASNFDNKTKINSINRIRGVYVQSETILKNLNEIGVTTAIVMHNFKYMVNYNCEYDNKKPFRFIYLSRVSEEKGIFECLDVINKVTDEMGEQICTLDIYGKIDEEIKDEFMKKISNFANIRYCGVIKPNEASSVIKDYFMLIFPTKYEGEGFPGTVIDAFAGGVPLLTSRFSNFNDMLIDGYDCVSFAFMDYEEMKDKMLYCINHPTEINVMRKNAYNESFKYIPEKEVSVLIRNMTFKGKQ